MANLSVESSAFTQSQAQYISDIKAANLSRFLNQRPIYVKYLVNNQTLSTTDAGMGNIYEEIGPQSSMTYNLVSNLPVFNLPELKPDVTDDEGGYNIELEINDIGFLPGTVRPKPSDYMIVEIAGAPVMLFRCTSYRHNTIKSNDFYLADFSLVDLGVQSQENRENSTELRNGNYLNDIMGQVVKKMVCRELDVGTNEKFIVEEETAAEAADIGDVIEQLIDFYNDAFYQAELDGFALREGNPPYNTQYYVDNFQTRFINESEIFRNDSSDYTKILPYLELKQLNFDYLYNRTLWKAVLAKTGEYLHKYVYAWDRLIQKRTSPFLMASIPAIHPTLELLDHYVKPEEPVPPEAQGIVWTPGQNCGWTGTDPLFGPYFNLKLTTSIASGVVDKELNPIERLIAQYVINGPDGVVYNRKDIINFAFKQDRFSFLHMPIVIYVLKQCQKAILAS